MVSHLCIYLLVSLFGVVRCGWTLVDLGKMAALIAIGFHRASFLPLPVEAAVTDALGLAFAWHV